MMMMLVVYGLDDKLCCDGDVVVAHILQSVSAVLRHTTAITALRVHVICVMMLCMLSVHVCNHISCGYAQRQHAACIV